MLIAALLITLYFASADARSSRHKRFFDFSNFNLQDAISTIEDGIANIVEGTNLAPETETGLLAGLGDALDDLAQNAEQMIQTVTGDLTDSHISATLNETEILDDLTSTSDAEQLTTVTPVPGGSAESSMGQLGSTPPSRRSRDVTNATNQLDTTVADFQLSTEAAEDTDTDLFGKLGNLWAAITGQSDTDSGDGEIDDGEIDGGKIDDGEIQSFVPAGEPNLLEQVAGNLWAAISGDDGADTETATEGAVTNGTVDQAAADPDHDPDHQEGGFDLGSLLDMASTFGQGALQDTVDNLGDIDLNSLAETALAVGQKVLLGGGIDIPAEISMQVLGTIKSLVQEMADDGGEVSIGETNTIPLSMISAIGDNVLKDGKIEISELDQMVAVFQNVVEGGGAGSDQPAKSAPAGSGDGGAASAPSGQAAVGRMAPGGFVLVLATFVQIILA